MSAVRAGAGLRQAYLRDLMGGHVEYNYEVFALGTRVKVHAAQPREGSDYDWHGHTGKVIRSGPGFVVVKMDKRRRDWKSDEVFVCNHNLRKAT